MRLQSEHAALTERRKDCEQHLVERLADVEQQVPQRRELGETPQHRALRDVPFSINLFL